MPNLRPNQPIFMAILPAGDDRQAFWHELFGCNRVPVKSDEPATVIFPDNSKKLCYMLDFHVTGPELKEGILAANRRRDNNPVLVKMLEDDIYPIIANGITVVKATLSLWVKCNQSESEAAG
jgi:hypothetical protein